MRDRLRMCRTLGCSLAGAQPPANRLLKEPRFGQVPSEKLGLGRDPIGKIGLQNRGDAGVKLLAPAPQKAAIGRVADKRVLEEILRVGRSAAGEDEAGRAEPS